MNEAIKLAMKSGYKGPLLTEEVYLAPLRRFGVGTALDMWRAYVAQDPNFWQALGKALGNKDEMRCDSPKCDNRLCEYAGYKEPKRMFDNYMDCIWWGYDLDRFWQELLKQNI